MVRPKPYVFPSNAVSVGKSLLKSAFIFVSLLCHDSIRHMASTSMWQGLIAVFDVFCGVLFVSNMFNSRVAYANK